MRRSAHGARRAHALFLLLRTRPPFPAADHHRKCPIRPAHPIPVGRAWIILINGALLARQPATGLPHACRTPPRTLPRRLDRPAAIRDSGARLAVRHEQGLPAGQSAGAVFFFCAGFNLQLFFCARRFFLPAAQADLLHGFCGGGQACFFFAGKKYRQPRARRGAEAARILESLLGRLPDAARRARPRKFRACPRRRPAAAKAPLPRMSGRWRRLCLVLAPGRRAVRGAPAGRTGGSRILPGSADARSGSRARPTCRSTPHGRKPFVVRDGLVRESACRTCRHPSRAAGSCLWTRITHQPPFGNNIYQVGTAINTR